MLFPLVNRDSSTVSTNSKRGTCFIFESDKHTASELIKLREDGTFYNVFFNATWKYLMIQNNN